MGRSTPVNLGHLSFENQHQALDHFSSILARTPIGSILAGRDFEDVEALLSGHPRAEEKIGPGISNLIVLPAEMGAKCFHVARTDGKVENFSIKKCISGDPSPFTAFSAACRRAVRNDIDVFKDNYFAKEQNADGKVRCPETNRWLTKGEAHVDHPPPTSFSVIVKFFRDMREIDLSSIQYNRGGLYGASLADDTLAEDFRMWHRKTARLRVIDGARNLQKASLGRVQPTKADRKL